MNSRADCAFCRQSTDVSPTGDGLSVLIQRAGRPATQEFWAHAKCLREHLESSFPFDPSIFGDDWRQYDNPPRAGAP
ncbi:MAG: hypothetical protein ABR946_02715 [Solirubrobacteraceae bacterium]